MTMKKIARGLMKMAIGFALIVFNLSCNKNVLEQWADKGTDDALFYSAQQEVNARNYTGAISTIGSMSSGYRSSRATQFLLASAYSGRCGLDFIPLANALTNMASGTSLLDVVLTQMTNIANVTDCETAESTLRALSPGASGVFTDTDEALQMAIIGLAKIGAILSVDTGTYAGSPNASFDACHVSASSADTLGLSDADVDAIGTGLTIAYNNLQVNTSFASAITSMTSICMAISGPPINDAICEKTTPGFSTLELKVLRGLVNYQSVGIGSQSTFTMCP